MIRMIDLTLCFVHDKHMMLPDNTFLADAEE